ncbi:MAG: J domain-containing protein [Aquabacterium sp.]|uniref:J domain-containing protein n=1 Tax=Aquabacterium sp. TaxID=1872578 RepID=UPI0027228491|nr:J domain-containing protein [Aquabacterium sp.]MDO9005041.1 J domain-containing protein [Aquabacterium sp.]
MTSPSTPVAISAATPTQALSPEQKRFNKLTQQIEQARDKLACWHESLPPFITAMRERTLPLAQAAQQTQTTWVHELGRLLEQKGWNQRERATMQDLLCEAAWHLLQGQDEPDPELQALYDKHADDPFGEAQQQDHEAFIDMVEKMTGVDLGDDAMDHRPEELLERARQKLAENAEHQQADSQPTKPTKPSKAQARKQAELELTAQSLRDIYRKLASALHPDREPDPDKRAARTALMQRANQAYDQKDLLGLLALQLETAQINQQDLALTAPARLKLYNKALAEQLADIQYQLRHLEYNFRMDFNVPPTVPLHPNKLVKVLDMQVKELRLSHVSLEQDLQAFQDKQATKRWLRREMARFEMEAMSGDWF